MHVNDFKKLLSEKYNISTIGIAKAMGSWPGPDPLEIPDLYWDREVPEHSRTSLTRLSSSRYLCDIFL